MDNSMTEYKKQSKLADVIDSLKFKAKILFAGKNQYKIADAIKGRDASKRLEALEEYSDNLYSSDIVGIINTLDAPDKSIALEKYADQLSGYQLQSVIEKFNDAEKIKNIEKYKDKLGSEFEKVLLSMENKMEVIEKYGNEISKSSFNQLFHGLRKEEQMKALGLVPKEYIDNNIINLLDGKEKIQALSMGTDNMDRSDIKGFVNEFDGEEKISLIKVYKDKFESKDLVEFIQDVDKKEYKAELLSECAPNIETNELGVLLNTIDSEDRRVILSENVDRFKDEELSLFVEGFDSQDKVEFVKFCAHEDNAAFEKLFYEVESNERKDILLETSDKFDDEALKGAVISLDDKDKVNSIDNFEERFNIESIKEIIGSMEDPDVIKDVLEKKNMCKEEEVEIAAEYVAKLNHKVLRKNEMLTKDAVELLGEEQHYELFKKIIIDGKGENLDITQALENPDKFKGYMQLRENYKNKQEGVHNLVHGIEEYNKHYELIDNIMEENLITMEELLVLEQLTKGEPYKEITKKEDLSKFAQLRKERYKDLIKDGPKENKELIYELDSKDRKEVIFETAKRFDVYELGKVVRDLENKDKAEALDYFEDRFDMDSTKVIIGTMDDPDIIKDALEKREICEKDELELASEYMAKLNSRVLDKKEMLTKDAVELLGENEHYELFKYIVIPGEGDSLDITDALKNPTKFKGYMQLRENYKDQKLPVQKLANAIEEYSNHHELINNIMEEEQITTEQLLILDQLTKDKPYEEIKTKADLSKFTQLREERYKELIQNDSKEAIYQMLLGMSKEEYQSLEGTFSKDKKLSEELREISSSFPEEQERMAEITAMLKVVELVDEMPEDQRQKTLQCFNEDLAKEFEGGSKIASVRDEMSGLRHDVRKMFGKELSNSLDVEINDNTKKEIIHEDGKEDIEVIHMEGEEFNVLITAIDAYGSGNGHFENREVGNQYICTSLISDKFMGRAEGTPIVGFTNFGEEALIQEGSRDIWSYGKDGEFNAIEIEAKRGNGFRTSEKLVKETIENGARYNEVNLWREYMNKDGEKNILLPSHVVCFDEIDELSKQEARLIAEKFGLDKPIPIMIINQEKYKERIEDYKREAFREAREANEMKKVEMEQGIGEDETISKRVEEIMDIAEERAESREVAKAQMEIMNSQEQTKEVEQTTTYKKPTAMMSKDDGFEH